MSTAHITVVQCGKAFTLDFSEFNLPPERIAERLSDLICLLESIVEADVFREGLSEERLFEVLPGILAQDLVFQAMLSETARHASLVLELTTGRKSASDVGFPEFASDAVQHD